MIFKKSKFCRTLEQEYLQKAANTISKFEAYLIEDDLHGDEMVLRKIIDTNRSGGVSTDPFTRFSETQELIFI